MLAVYWFVLAMAVPPRSAAALSPRFPSLSQTDPESRLEALLALHRARPRAVRYLREIAITHTRAGRHMAAGSAWQQYARRSTDSAEACPAIVEAYRLAGRSSAVANVLERCARLRHRDARLWLALARSREEQSQRHAAAAAYHRASLLDWRSPSPWLGLARIRLAEGRFAEAGVAASRALSLAPDNTEAVSLAAQSLGQGAR
jgi:tetratricopeptide (TPR) repeat protein